LPHQPLATPPSQAKRTTRRWAAALLLSLALTPAAAEECVKSVFNRFCLGGSAETLPDSSAADTAEAELALTSRGKQVHVELHEGMITGVWREEPPGSWINYLEWRNKLIRLYGRGSDLSDFPAYARSRSSRLNAVIAGKGSARTQWEQNGWRVAVIWDNPDYVTLRYELRERRERSATTGSEGL